MSRDQGRYLLVVALLLVAVGMVYRPVLYGGNRPAAADFRFVADVDNWQRTERERTVVARYDFSLDGELTQLPLRIGDWTGLDIPQTNVEVFILLEPEQYVQRMYTLPDGRYVYLSLIGSRKSKSFHSPQICYDADGWGIDTSSEPVALGTGEVRALRLVASKGSPDREGKKHIILYFYLWPDNTRDPQEGTVLLKVTAPLYGSIDESIGLEKQFLRELFVDVVG